MWRGMNVSFRDMLFLLVFAYLVIGAVALAHVRKQAQEETAGKTPPGSVTVEIHWDDKVDADVDLWVQGPGDVPVGYSNKNGIIFNLVRDDLGHSAEPIAMNYEVSYARGLWPGEYVVNAHLYRSADHRFPVEVRATVSTSDVNGQTRRLLQSKIELAYVGQETTIFRFKLDESGGLVAGSLNRIHKGLRAAQMGEEPQK
ncbi:MAG: hypothetical protein ACM3O6_17180 [Acidobacteriota bacterium]